MTTFRVSTRPRPWGNAGFRDRTGANAPSVAGGTLTIKYTAGAATTANQKIIISNIAYDVGGGCSPAR